MTEEPKHYAIMRTPKMASNGAPKEGTEYLTKWLHDFTTWGVPEVAGLYTRYQAERMKVSFEGHHSVHDPDLTIKYTILDARYHQEFADRVEQLTPLPDHHFEQMTKRNESLIVNISETSPLAVLHHATINLRRARDKYNESLRSEMLIIPSEPIDHEPLLAILNDCQKKFNIALSNARDCNMRNLCRPIPKVPAQ